MFRLAVKTTDYESECSSSKHSAEIHKVSVDPLQSFWQNWLGIEVYDNLLGLRKSNHHHGQLLIVSMMAKNQIKNMADQIKINQ